MPKTKKNKNQTLVLTTPELDSMEDRRASKIRSIFEPMAKTLEAMEDDYNQFLASVSESEIVPETCSQARELRLKIAKIRIETEKKRKEEKRFFLLAGRAIDGVANIIKFAIGDKEERLREIERHYEIIEERKREKRQEARVNQLKKYVDPESPILERDYRDMDDDVWDAFLESQKRAKEEREEAERKAREERERKAREEAEERERLRKEAEAERKAREEAERKAKAERERMRKKAEAERKAREKAERKAKAEREAREEAVRKAEEEAALKAQQELEAIAERARAEVDRINRSKDEVKWGHIKNEIHELLDKYPMTSEEFGLKVTAIRNILDE